MLTLFTHTTLLHFSFVLNTQTADNDFSWVFLLILKIQVSIFKICSLNNSVSANISLEDTAEISF